MDKPKRQDDFLNLERASRSTAYPEKSAVSLSDRESVMLARYRSADEATRREVMRLLSAGAPDHNTE